MMMKCRDVSHLVASGDADDMSLMKRMELRLHLMMCNHCRNYVRQIKTLGAMTRRLIGAREPSSKELQQLEDSICTELLKQGGGSTPN